MELKVGSNFSKSFLVTEEIVKNFAECTSDKNPVHLDEEYAAGTFFKGRIAHGFLVGSFISAVLGNDFPGNGTIYISQNLKFLKPVYFNETINVVLEVTEILDRNWIRLSTKCLNKENKMVIDGEAVIIPPSDCTIVNA